MWADSFFRTISDALTYLKAERDPEQIRRRRLIQIENELKRERNIRDEILLKVVTLENELQTAIDMGVSANNIIRLLSERQGLIR